MTTTFLTPSLVWNGTLDASMTAVKNALTAGMSIFKTIDLDENPEEITSNAPATLYFMAVFNMTTSPLFLKVYLKTGGSVAVGATVPDMTFVIPANANASGAGFILPIPAAGIYSVQGITVACTTGVADNNTGAPATNACILVAGYK
jgi:hypothetical protein